MLANNNYFIIECKAAGATTVDGLEFMRRLERNIRPRSWMLAAIKTIRNEGLKVLTSHQLVISLSSQLIVISICSDMRYH